MNKYLIVIVFLSLNSCKNNSSEADSQKEEVVLTNKELLIKRYNESVVPMFKEYKTVVIPKDFQVDIKDSTVNAGASFGYVEVSQGLIDIRKEVIQVYVLAHEVSHIVTIKQARLFGLQGDIPRGNTTNDYKKAEYFADLIAVHLIQTKSPEIFKSLFEDSDYLQQLLGTTTFTHPSGIDRINSIKEYIRNSKDENEAIAFKKQFLSIWNMN